MVFTGFMGSCSPGTVFAHHSHSGKRRNVVDVMSQQNSVTDAKSGAASAQPSDRRRTPRIEMLGHIFGQVLSVDTPVTVLELGLGGFSIETRCAFRVGSRHEFRFILDNGASVIVTAKVAHCRHRTAPSGADLFVTGLQFLESSDGGAAVSYLIDGVTSRLSFE
jgi:PilZ domain-containing protein